MGAIVMSQSSTLRVCDAYAVAAVPWGDVSGIKVLCFEVVSSPNAHGSSVAAERVLSSS